MTLKILRIAQKLYPEVPGGGPYHVHALSRDQAALGHDVTVLTIRSSPDEPRRERRDGYTVLRYDSTVNLLGNDVSIGLGRRLRGADGFDVVHAHSHLYSSTVLAAVKRRFDGTPLAVTNHGLYSQSAPRRVFEWYLRTVGRWTFDASDRIFCYTDVDRDRIRDLGVETPISVIENGIDLDRFTPDGPTHDALPPEGPVVLFVGRLVGGKHPETVLDAFETVRAEVPDARLVFVGDGPMKGDLQERAGELSIGDAVSFLGYRPYEELPSIYRGADVLALPSETEGFPRVILEALASGVPVVSSDLRQLRSLLDGAGVLVPVADSDATARALVDLLTDEGRRQTFAETGRHRVRDDHSWAETVRRTTDVLRELTD